MIRGLAAALALVLAQAGPGGAQETPAAPKPLGAVAALSGRGTITHAAQRAESPVKVEDSVFVRDKITTAEQSVVRVLMGGRITITIRERSIVTITDDPTRTRVDLDAGMLAFKVHDGGLRPGEVAELRTPNAITGIRGSLVVASVTAFDSLITVVEARHTITIATRANPTQTTPLPVGHTVRVTGPRASARIGPVAKAAKDHLDRAAATAEVPGRPRDGGQERTVRFDPQIGRLLPVETKATAAPAVSPPPVSTPAKTLSPAATERIESVPRVVTPPAPAPAPAAKAPSQLRRVTPGLAPNVEPK